MSGVTDVENCHRCGSTESVETYSDWKPHDSVSGFCHECGYFFHTVTRLANLKEVNEERERINEIFEGDEDFTLLQPLTQLAPPTQEWLASPYEPENSPSHPSHP